MANFIGEIRRVEYLSRDLYSEYTSQLLHLYVMLYFLVYRRHLYNQVRLDLFNLFFREPTLFYYIRLGTTKLLPNHSQS